MMGIYSRILLFLGIFVIGLVYAKVGVNKPSHHAQALLPQQLQRQPACFLVLVNDDREETSSP
jgi:hypothetical protein